MGGSSKSKTSSDQTTTNVQDIDTTTIGLEDVETGIVGNSGAVSLTQITTDSGAVDSAFDFGRAVGERAIDTVGEFGGDALYQAFRFGDSALGSVDNGLNSALDFGESALGIVAQSSNKAQAALSGALQTVGNLSRSDNTEAITKFIPYVAGVVAIIAIAWAYKGSK
jgi:hypothetical protein